MIKSLERKRGISLLLSIIFVIQVYFTSSITSQSSGGGSNLPAIIYHICSFFLITFFLLIAINGNKKINKKTIVFVIAIVFVYAILDEFHQSFVPGRDSSVKDVLLDTIGIIFSTSIYIFINKKTKKKIYSEEESKKRIEDIIKIRKEIEY